MSAPARRQSPLLTFLVLVAVAVGVWAVVKFVVFRQGGDAERPPLAELRLEPLTGSGRPRSLADLRGKVTLVNFWGTWCPPCVMEFPHMVELQRKFAGRADFEFLSVSCLPDVDAESEAELRTATQAFLDRREVRLDTYHDPDGVTRKAVAAAVGFEGYPTTVLLDRQANIARFWSGYAPGLEDEIREAIEAALQENDGGA